MSENFDKNLEEQDGLNEGKEEHSDYKPADTKNENVKHQLSGMYQNWFLDYASYVILERAVPHIMDGLKPVQRRILHTMRRMEDGRYNKVANIVGEAMKFHPHGDASIKDALVQLGQKDLLIDCQGNWGNILTGDDAAAARYIEARLTKFALDVVFNPKTTEWKLSYDGRNREPVTLPVKFPLLLAQGVEGIAVGLSSKILPHNFNELCDAAVSYLHGEEFRLYPDFQTGGSIDVSKYNDGERGGSVRVRSRIEKVDNKTLAIREIPYGKTVANVCDSIVKASEKGKIKIRKVEDLTSGSVEILVHLTPGTSSDKTIDALYAFTDCEVSISPNCCVIDDRKPHFLTVSNVLRKSVDNTRDLLRCELEIHRDEVCESLHFASLEKIFIEERIYKDKEFEQAKNMDAACEHIDLRLTPYYPQFIREVTKDDILRLMEIKMARILKFNSDKAEEQIARMKADIEETERHLANLVEYTVNWFRMLKEKYGKNFPRRTRLYQGHRGQREALHQPRGGLHRHQPEEGRVPGQLFEPGRRHPLLPRRPLHYHPRSRQEICGQKHTLRQRLQEERQAHHLQRVLPRRQGWHDLYQAIRRDIHCTRPRIRRNARYTRLQNHVLQRQPQR